MKYILFFLFLFSYVHVSADNCIQIKYDKDKKRFHVSWGPTPHHENIDSGACY